MRKNIIWFFIGAFLTFIVLVSLAAFNNLKKENISDLEQVAYAHSELDRSLFISADNKFKNGDIKGSLEDMKAREIIRKVFHSKNQQYQTKDDEAIECLTKLIKLNEEIKKNTDDYKLYYERANLQSKPKISMFEDDEQSFCSDYNSAIKDYSKVIELNPDLKEVYAKRADTIGVSMIGVKYDNKDEISAKFKLMIADYEKAIKLNSATNETYLSLAGVYLSDGQYQKALETFEKYPQDKKFGYAHYFGKALCYYKLKDYKKVIENLDLYIQHNPKLCKEISENCLTSHSGEKAYYRLRAKANLKLHRYKDWLKDIIKAGF